MDYSVLLFGIIITFISYEAFPFISVFLMRKEYNEEQAKKMAKWNSIIVGLIYLIITVDQDQNVTWSPAPAILYYFINSSIWVKKEKNTTEKINEAEEETEKNVIKNETKKKEYHSEKKGILKSILFVLSIILMVAMLAIGIISVMKLPEYYDHTLINSKIIYTINESKWEEEEIKTEYIYDTRTQTTTKTDIKEEYKSSCGFLFVSEIYATNLFPDISSEIITDDLIDKTNIDKIADGISKQTNVDIISYEKEKYNMKFIKIESEYDDTNAISWWHLEIEQTLGEGKADKYNKITQYLTINNGYVVIYQFNFKKMSPKCEKEIEKVVKTVDKK